MRPCSLPATPEVGTEDSFDVIDLSGVLNTTPFSLLETLGLGTEDGAGNP